jgi:hypothetical protein
VVAAVEWLSSLVAGALEWSCVGEDVGSPSMLDAGKRGSRHLLFRFCTSPSFRLHDGNLVLYSGRGGGAMGTRGRGAMRGGRGGRGASRGRGGRGGGRGGKANKPKDTEMLDAELDEYMGR